jgi:hypothetical protein
MANLRPDQLSGVSSLDDNDILIAEINPNSTSSRKVVKISARDFLSGVSGDDTTATNIGSGVDLVSGVVGSDIKVKTIQAGENVSIVSGLETITINASGGGGGPSIPSASFAFFSNALNNQGIIQKTYYSTPTSDTYLSGIDVDSANDITLYLRWGLDLLTDNKSILEISLN